MSNKAWATTAMVCINLLWASSAWSASEYRCMDKTVQNDAIAVSYTDVDVAAHSNPYKKTCTFTIDGSKQRANGVRGSSLSRAAVFSSAINIDFIVKRLTLSRFVAGDMKDNITPKITGVLADRKDQLISCFSELKNIRWQRHTEPVSEGPMKIFINFSADGMQLSCIIYPSGNYNRVTFGEKTLVLLHRDRREESEDVLFVPTGALQR